MMSSLAAPAEQIVAEDWVSNDTARRVLLYLDYAYPLILLVYFLIAVVTTSIIKSRNRNQQNATQLTGPGGRPLPGRSPHENTKPEPNPKQCLPKSQKILLEWVAAFTAVTYLGNSANVIFHAVWDRDDGWWCGQPVVIYLVGSFFVYTLFVIHLLDSKSAPSPAHFTTWLLALLMEFVLLGTSLAIYTHGHREPIVGRPGKGQWRDSLTKWEIIEVAIDLIRIVSLIGLLGLYLMFRGIRLWPKKKETASESEITGLLSSSASTVVENGSATANGEPRTYGTVPASSDNGNSANGHGHQDQPAGWARPDKVPTRSWWEYLRGYAVIFPYLWPSKDRRLQVVVVICFSIMVIQRFVNVLVPYQIGVITTKLAGHDGHIKMPWGQILLFVLYKLLQGNNGLLGATRSVLWVPVSQYSYRELSVASFEHVHSLSLDFHLGKKTGEVLSALGKGSSVNNFLESVTFQVIPMLFDLGVAIGYFLIAFDAYYALIVAVVTFWYVYLTIRMAQWRNAIRRDMTNADRAADAVKNDSMVSYETVKYFNAEQYEFDRYRQAVTKYQKSEYLVLMSLNLLNVTQNLVFMLGLMIACFVAAYQVTTDQLDVGDFVVLVSYLGQLQGPLNFFGTFYRIIQSSMINSERMLELFKEQPTVVDKPGVKDMPTCKGDIKFKEVHFAYDNRNPALQGLDFHCKPGTTTAFVGESGGGKSTVFRLLFRYYSSQGGKILIDDQDVEDVSIESLRRHIGVVPQDTVLFNETLMYNLRYARPDATDEEIYDACRAASIHDRIMGFQEGYNTLVGERGLRLSGGEKQRVAIARAMLKGPRIIMLDEATAALDTTTEEHIQEEFQTLSEGRTMLVIAHRLSTITRADQILVLYKGRVAEKGTHDELLVQKGMYADMWRRQVKAQKAAEEAHKATQKAERLRRASSTVQSRPRLEGIVAASDSDEESEATAVGTAKANVEGPTTDSVRDEAVADAARTDTNDTDPTLPQARSET